MPRNFLGPGRVPVHAAQGVAATSHPLATFTAVDILKQGGNAIDAAIAAVAVQGVVEPQMTGIGGDCFALIKKKDSDIIGINGSGRAAAAADPERLREKGFTAVPETSAHAITVPGAVAAWEKILDLAGTKGLDTLLAPAIGYAEKGFAVTPRVASDWKKVEDLLLQREKSKETLLPGERAPVAGERIRLPGLAEAMREIAEKGSGEFYTGVIAEDIAASVAADGGLLGMDDLAANRTDEVEPLRTDYRGTTLVELPPNTHGMTAQLILNILESFDIEELDPVGGPRFHLFIEAARMAYGVRDEFIADPDSMTVDPKDILSKAYALRLASDISLHRRNDTLPSFSPVMSDTVYLCVADAEGNAISLINSLFGSFGSGLVTERFGIPLHNRGACFNLLPGHPNEYGPGKRPMHTIIPAMTLEGGELRHVYGVMGGHYQPLGHAHVLSNIIDFGMDLQEAVDCPRVFWEPDQSVGLEATAGDGAVSHLQSCGHNAGLRNLPWGGAQILEFNRNFGTLSAASDPRKDGLALGF